VTDANLVLGRVDATLGGKLQLNLDLAFETIRNRIAEPLGLDPVEAAEGIIKISCNNMSRAISLVTTDRGRDPRDFVPVVFGGAGPMMICFVAELLDIPRAIIPSAAGVCSAEGAIMMPLKTYSEQTFFSETDSLDLKRFNTVLDELAEKVKRELVEQGAESETINLRRIAEMRYQGQSYEVMVDIPEGRLDRDEVSELVDCFHQAHQREYFVCNRDFLTAILNVRVEGTAYLGEVKYPTYPEAGSGVEDALKSSREVFFEGVFTETPVYDYEKLRPSHTIMGPAVVEMAHSCLIATPRWQISLDEYRNLILQKMS
jgi:N-methylhydantoinase A